MDICGFSELLFSMFLFVYMFAFDFFIFSTYKYNLELYDAVMECFDNLPIAATINGKFLCCHGGLSPDISTVQDIEELDRFQEVPREGAFCDLLWSDPVDEDKNKDEEDYNNDESTEPTTWFAYNETRQCSYVFGVDAVVTFLKKNNLTAIIRAHEAQFDGYKMQFVNEQTGIPRVITIFSAPNYCDVYKNKGACLKFDDELLNIRQFVNSPHPYYLPNFMDVFTWSLPFVAEKVLKENQDNIVKLKQLSPRGHLPSGVLQGGQAAIEKALSSFNEAKRADKSNDAMPSQEKTSKSPRKNTGQIFYRAEKDT
ncbi:serine/threonine protein phosphatase [Reticulomyxa filosa]|uniref:Serine/threonine protein phosphatase n=1 Tax=Reticulomyxa filosa TaxID=46433 RepID=X6LTK7_RETFI|nr:serine/threonine protein phosphatase [Reticulomyxa filosa]|eukprot:ETO04964.1 serine/threonine protein phosphatase [Reticulomyxa filosa]